MISIIAAIPESPAIVFVALVISECASLDERQIKERNVKSNQLFEVPIRMLK